MAGVSLNSLYQIARSGMLAQQMRVDAVANNVANVNTVGFKENRMEFQELLNRAEGEMPEVGSRALGEAAGAVLVDSQRLYNQGVIKASNNPWDMAIDGDGFFQLQLPDGTIGYTRDGSFQPDANGQLVNGDGYPLVPPIQVPEGAQESMVSEDGVISVRLAGETEPQVIGTLTLARFTNEAGLEAIGDNLYQPTDASGAAQVGQPGAAGMGAVQGFASEMSNVDLSRQVTELMRAQRTYSLLIRALESSDQMLSMASEMRLG